VIMHTKLLSSDVFFAANIAQWPDCAQTHWGSLQRSHRPASWTHGPYF